MSELFMYVHPLSLVERHTESIERDESPNGGRYYEPQYRQRAALVPSWHLRRILRAAADREQRWERLGRWLGVIGL